MTLGVRSYGSSLRMQNVFNPDALPDTDARLKNFARKILVPEFKCVESNCGTTIGRRVPIPEIPLDGLIRLDNNQRYTEDDEYELLENGEFFARVRDSVSCISEGGTCAFCGNGYYARLGIDDSMAVGQTHPMPTSARSFQNYIAKRPSGSLIGFNVLTSDPLSAPSGNWAYLTSHSEMDRMCALLGNLKVTREEIDYLYSIEDVLERALAIIAVYGVYGNV